MLKNTGLKYGIIGAVILVAWLTGLYFTDKNLITHSFYTYWLPLLVFYPLLMYKSASDDQQSGVDRIFREAIRTPFLTFTVANVFFWLCLYGLHLADPELSKMELTQQLHFAEEQLKQGLGDPQQMNEIRQQVNDISAELNRPIQQPMGPYFFSMAIWMILGFGIAAAVTALVRSMRQ
jgi:Protein of unknown function (DUF4199)